MIKEIVSDPLQNVLQAFTDHLLISVRKQSGTVLGPGYIMIMYGEIAFRFQVNESNESHFIRMEEIGDIIIHP
jgi:hypothetical protein